VTPTYTEISASYTQTNVSCNGGSDGSLTVNSASGGSGGAYTVSLDGVNYFALPKTFSSLIATGYTLNVKASNGAVKGISVTITQPSAQTATTTVTANDTSGCNGSIQITSTGGVFPKTYRVYLDSTAPYTTCGGTLVTTITGVTDATATQNVNSLCAGGYCVEVTDANGCIVNSTVVEVVNLTNFVTLDVYATDTNSTRANVILYYNINSGGSINLVTNSQLPSPCGYIGSITGLSRFDVVTFTTTSGYVMSGTSNSTSCPTPGGGSITYTYNVVATSGIRSVALAIDSGSPL
jgi:hypothetical protein